MSQNRLLRAADLSEFSEQLAMAAKTGIPLAEGLMVLREDAGTKAAERLTEGIQGALEQGKPLAEALRESGAFPDYMVRMTEIGEASGRLDNVLGSLAAYYAREDSLSKSIRSAVIYPSIMLAVLVGIILVLVVKVLPIFNEVFQSMGGTMPAFAKGAFVFGQAISRYSLAIIIALAAAALLLAAIRAVPAGRRLLGAMARGMFRKLSFKISSVKFSSGMSLMLASGLDVGKALDLALPMIDDKKMARSAAELQASVRSGESFSESAVRTKVFSGMQGRLLLLGFKSGNTDEVMGRIAKDNEAEVDARLDRLVSSIEPTMVAVLCLIVGLILLSSMLPLLAVISAVM